MKEIKAIVQPFLLSKVVEALKEIEGLPGITVSEVRGFGRAPAVAAALTVVAGSIEYAKKAKLEIVVSDSLVERVIQTIREQAHTGNLGDGKIFIYRVDDVIRIRTGERGANAI